MGSLRDSLRGQRVYLDANVFIYALEGIEPWATSLHGVFSGLDAGELIAITSRLTLAECLVRPFALGREDLVQVYRLALSPRPSLEIAPLQTELLVSAARLRAELGFKLPDAIHVATALMQGCTAMLTNDAGFRRAPDLTLFLLSEWGAPSC